MDQETRGINFSIFLVELPCYLLYHLCQQDHQEFPSDQLQWWISFTTATSSHWQLAQTTSTYAQDIHNGKRIQFGCVPA